MGTIERICCNVKDKFTELRIDGKFWVSNVKKNVSNWLKNNKLATGIKNVFSAACDKVKGFFTRIKNRTEEANGKRKVLEEEAQKVEDYLDDIVYEDDDNLRFDEDVLEEVDIDLKPEIGIIWDGNNLVFADIKGKEIRTTAALKHLRCNCSKFLQLLQNSLNNGGTNSVTLFMNEGLQEKIRSVQDREIDERFAQMFPEKKPKVKKRR